MMLEHSYGERVLIEGVTVGLWGRWGIATSLSIMAFTGTWWGLEAGDHIDSGTALGVAAVPFTIVITLGGVWADQARGEEKASSKRETTNNFGSWPDPSSIKGMKDYIGLIRRTWIRAGAPDINEVLRNS